MNLKLYRDYFKYVCEHKKNVFIECINMSKQYKGKNKKDLIIHAFTHDLSKFLPCEFIPYAKYFYGNYIDGTVAKLKAKENFNKAWKHHYLFNKHHWNYWCSVRVVEGILDLGNNPIEMPTKYMRQMVCDWKAMGRKFGDTAQEYYLKNYTKIKLSHNTRLAVECTLGLCYRSFSECDQYYWMTIEEIIKDCLEYEKSHPNNFDRHWFYNEFLQEYKDKYNIDMLEILEIK